MSSRVVIASGLYLYEYTYDDNGNLISEDRHRAYELNVNQYTNIRRYEYTKDNKLESVYSGNTLLVSYTYDGDGTITSSLERDLDLNQNLNIHDTNYLNSLTNNQRQLINKVPTNDSFLYEFTEYITDKNRPYSETLMERDGTGQLSTIYTYGNQRINSESYNNLSGLYAYDGRGSVSAVIGSYGDFRASYWYDGLGNVKSQIYGYGAFGSGKKYYGYNAESYNSVTGNQNLRNRQVNIRRQRFLTEDTYIGDKINALSLNRYIYANNNPLKYVDPNGLWAIIISLNGIINPLIGTEADIGFALGYNKYEGIVAKPVVSGGAVFSSHPGVSGGISATIDFRDIPVGSGMTTSYGGSVRTSWINASFGGDINFDTNTGELSGFTIGFSGGASFNPLPIEIHSKEIWSYAKLDEELKNIDTYHRHITKTWYINENRIANPSDISLLDKTNLSIEEENRLSELLNAERLYVDYYSCRYN